MQANLRLIILTILGLVGAWFLVMTLSMRLFSDSDVDASFTGSIPMSKTDIGDRCGIDYRGSNELIDYKLNTRGQIVYLCPLGISPIYKKVVAVSIPEAFRKLLTPAQLIKLNALYAPVQPQNVFNPVVQPQPMSAVPPSQSDITAQSATTMAAAVPVTTTPNASNANYPQQMAPAQPNTFQQSVAPSTAPQASQPMQPAAPAQPNNYSQQMAPSAPPAGPPTPVAPMQPEYQQQLVTPQSTNPPAQPMYPQQVQPSPAAQPVP